MQSILLCFRKAHFLEFQILDAADVVSAGQTLLFGLRIGDFYDVIFWGCTRLADMLPSKYEDNTLQIKEKSTERAAPFFCT